MNFFLLFLNILIFLSISFSYYFLSFVFFSFFFIFFFFYLWLTLLSSNATTYVHLKLIRNSLIIFMMYVCMRVFVWSVIDLSLISKLHKQRMFQSCKVNRSILILYHLDSIIPYNFLLHHFHIGNYLVRRHSN